MTMIVLAIGSNTVPTLSRSRSTEVRGSITRTGCAVRRSATLSSSCSVTRSTVRVSRLSVASLPGRSSATLRRMDDV
jgi:hypothetical protein